MLLSHHLSPTKIKIDITVWIVMLYVMKISDIYLLGIIYWKKQRVVLLSGKITLWYAVKLKKNVNRINLFEVIVSIRILCWIFYLN